MRHLQKLQLQVLQAFVEVPESVCSVCTSVIKLESPEIAGRRST